MGNGHMQCLPFEAIDRSITQIDRATASDAIEISIASTSSPARCDLGEMYYVVATTKLS